MKSRPRYLTRSNEVISCRCVWQAPALEEKHAQPPLHLWNTQPKEKHTKHRKSNRKFLAFSPISSLRGCSIMRVVCFSTLVLLLLCRANSSFVICWSTSCYMMPETSSRFIYSLLALHRVARSFLSHLKIHHDSLAMKIRYRGCTSFVHPDASWSVWSGRCPAC